MPDVVKHGWTHRPRALGGTDPIVIESGAEPVSAWANSYPVSVSHNGSTTLQFNELWRTPGSPYTANGGNEAAFNYIDLGQSGWYKADFTVYVNTNTFDAGDLPFIRSTCHFGASPDLLRTALYPTWNDEEGWIGSRMKDAVVTMGYNQWTATVWFNYDLDDVGSDFGIGVSLDSGGVETLTMGGWVAVVRLGALLEEVT